MRIVFDERGGALHAQCSPVELDAYPAVLLRDVGGRPYVLAWCPLLGRVELPVEVDGAAAHREPASAPRLAA